MEVQLILDTCAILDLIRAPVRKEFSASYALRAREVLARARMPTPSPQLIISDVVRTEFNRNLQAVLTESRRCMVKCCEEYRHALAIIANYSDVPAINAADSQWMEDGLRHVSKLADDMLSAATRELATTEDNANASRRVWCRIAPAEQGKNNLADCVITEMAIRMARNGGANGSKVILLSSNLRDFCGADRRLRPTLQIEFAAVALEYVRTWGEACTKIHEFVPDPDTGK